MDLPCAVAVPASMLTTCPPDLVAVASAAHRRAEDDAITQHLVDLGVPEHVARPVTVGEYIQAAIAAGLSPAEIDAALAPTAAHLARLVAAYRGSA